MYIRERKKFLLYAGMSGSRVEVINSDGWLCGENIHTNWMLRVLDQCSTDPSKAGSFAGHQESEPVIPNLKNHQSCPSLLDVHKHYIHVFSFALQTGFSHA